MSEWRIIEGECVETMKATGNDRLVGYESPAGRWPANVILGCPCEGDAHLPGCPVRELDAQSGERAGGRRGVGKGTVMGVALGAALNSPRSEPMYDDTGGASRFFYVAKASKRDRGEGNIHSTVKPTTLMRHLARLVTPPAGLVLDPFAGSGSTGVACLHEGMRFVGIEREPEYAEIARRRLRAVDPLLNQEAAEA